MTIILFGETGYSPTLMFQHTSIEIVRYTDIQHVVMGIAHHVYPVLVDVR